MANYLTHIIRIINDSEFQDSFLEKLCLEIAENTIELEKPLIYHIAENKRSIDLRYKCRRSWFDYTKLVENDKLFFAKISCNGGGCIDDLDIIDRTKETNSYDTFAEETAYKYDQIKIYGQESESSYLSEFNESLKNINSTLNSNSVTINSSGYFTCCSFDESSGDYNGEMIRKVSKDDFFKTYKSQPLTKIFFDEKSLERFYFEFFKKTKYIGNLISEVSKIQFLFNGRLVHEIHERITWPIYLTNNYWDNIMIEEDLRLRILDK